MAGQGKQDLAGDLEEQFDADENIDMSEDFESSNDAEPNIRRRKKRQPKYNVDELKPQIEDWENIGPWLKLSPEQMKVIKGMQDGLLASKSKFKTLIDDLIGTKANFMSELHDVEG